MQQLLFLDTETTGNDPKKDRLCQACMMTDGTCRTEYFKPLVPISIKSMSITHITDRMVADKLAFATSSFKKELEAALADRILVAHNAKFDMAMLAAEGVAVPRHICTLRVARHLDQDSKIPEYGLQYLRYFLDLDVDARAHDAEGDVRVLQALFARLFEKIKASSEYPNDDAVLAAMRDISERPSFIAVFPFGKYKGMRVADVAKTDRGYLEWLLKQKQSDGDQDEDWIFTLKKYVG